MKSLALWVVMASCTVLGACASSNYTDTERWDLVDSGWEKFIRHLHFDYVELSRREGAEDDWSDSKLFGNKANLTGGGEIVDPERIEDWDLPAEHVDELTDARARIVRALERGGAKVMPSSMARAQVMFDCWIHEQSENYQPEDIAFCRTGYLTAITNVETALDRPEATTEAPPAAMPPPAAPAQAPEVQRTYLVFFDWDKSEITVEAQSILESAAATAAEFGVSRVTITGHADRSGPNAYNLALSLRRAEAARAVLATQGVDTTIIAVDGRGEEDPLVPTPDGVREPQNRRAEIVLQP